MATCIMLSSFHTHPLRGPRRMSRPRHHLYEGRMGRRVQSPLSHTNAGTRDNTWQQAYRPAIIVVARSLLSPMSMYGRRFLLWGKGIKGQSHGIKKKYLTMYDENWSFCDQPLLFKNFTVPLKFNFLSKFQLSSS